MHFFKEDIEIVTKLMVDQNIFEGERLAKKKKYEEMQVSKKFH